MTSEYRNIRWSLRSTLSKGQLATPSLRSTLSKNPLATPSLRSTLSKNPLPQEPGGMGPVSFIKL